MRIILEQTGSSWVAWWYDLPDITVKSENAEGVVANLLARTPWRKVDMTELTTDSEKSASHHVEMVWKGKANQDTNSKDLKWLGELI